MPTGYTADIAKGISFEKFVWTCARGMGALVMMRDDPFNAPVPERFQPSAYNVEALAKARAERERIVGMTNAEADLAAAGAYEEARQQYEKRIADKDALRVKYQAMLAKVRDWTPPSKDHEGFKDFMDEQLTQSIDFDCSTRYMEPPPKLMTGSEWRAERLKDLDRDIKYHHDENAKEVSRTEQRNAWVVALRASVPPPNVTPEESVD